MHRIASGFHSERRDTMLTEKLFETNSYMREFRARVLQCIPLENIKKREDGAAYGIILDKTAFFPEGGGQTADIGNLGCAQVLDVQEVNGEILHYTDVPLPELSEVIGSLNWEQRLCKMQNHTGEHLVSGIVHQQFGYNNVGFHLGKDGVTVDFDGVLTEDELRFVEYIANRVIALNKAVTVSYPTPEEAAALDYRSKLDITENLRIVTIDGWDICACCAPHVNATGEIGAVKLLDAENWKGGIRLHMLCGLDAVSDYQKRCENTVRISNLLSVPQLEAANAVERLMNQMQADREEIGRLRRALLESKIAALRPTDRHLVLFDAELDANGIRNLVNAGIPLCGGICAGFLGNDSDGYRYVIGSTQIPLRAFAKDFNAMLNGRGGGSDAMIQGTVHASRSEIESFFNTEC